MGSQLGPRAWSRLGTWVWSWVWPWRGVWITVPLVFFSLVGLRSLGLLETLELAALDQFFLLRPRESVDDRLLLVTIDEADIDAVGRWPMSDAQLAQVIANLRQQQPRIIGLDLYRNLPVPPGETQLQTQLRASAESLPKVIGIEKLVGSGDSAAVAPQPILAAAQQIGANDFATEPDGGTRRIPIYLSLPEQASRFSFSFILACQYLEHQGKLCLQNEAGVVTVGEVPLPQLQPHSGGYHRDPTGGYFVLLNYRGPKAFSNQAVHCRRHGPQNQQNQQAMTFEAVCLEDVLKNQIPATVSMGDRIVILGPTAQSLNDLFYTPYSRSLLSPARERMPGVVVHANAVSQLLAAALENRPLLKTWSKGSENLWIFVWAGIGAGLSWQRGYRDQRRLEQQPKGLKQGMFWAEMVALMGLVGLGSYGAFVAGWWIPGVPAILALAGTAISVNAYIARTATEIRRIFGRYVTDQVVATLLENPEGLKIGGDRRILTLLTSDLRGFTATSERLPPEAVVDILNLYLSAMTDVIESYGGTIDKFIGDGILVLFGAPTDRSDDALRAIACAVAMQRAMAAVNQQVQQRNPSVKLEMGIGINTGEAVVGNIGSEKHTQYSVIGNQVNLAYRIEGFTVGGQILISDATLTAAGESLILGDQTQVQAKGISQPITVHEVLGVGAPFELHLPQREEAFIALPSPLAVQYVLLEGKQINQEPAQAMITQISSQGAWMVAIAPQSPPLSKLDNLKLTLMPEQASLWGNDDVYAKVIQVEDNRHLIRFTARSTTLKHWLEAYHVSSEGEG